MDKQACPHCGDVVAVVRGRRWWHREPGSRLGDGRICAGGFGSWAMSAVLKDLACIDCGTVCAVFDNGKPFRCIDCNSGPKPCVDCGVLVSDQPGLHKCTPGPAAQPAGW